MNDFESILAEQFHSASSKREVAALRGSVLGQVEQELRSRRRDRLLVRVVVVGLLVGLLGNFVTSRREQARLARWFPNANGSWQAFAQEDAVLVKTEEDQPHENRRAFEEYLLAWYSPADRAASNGSAARATAAWIDEFTRTGRGL